MGNMLESSGYKCSNDPMEEERHIIIRLMGPWDQRCSEFVVDTGQLHYFFPPPLFVPFHGNRQLYDPKSKLSLLKPVIRTLTGLSLQKSILNF